MKNKMSGIIKNISYSVIANILNVAISVLLITILPKYIDIKEYSAWQLYLFYVSYLGVFHFGWVDGIYLRYAGKYLKELNNKTFSGQIISLFVFELCLAVLGYILFTCFMDDTLLKQVLLFSCFVLPAYVLYWLLCYVLQITNNIKQYGQLLIFERILLLILIIFYLLLDFKEFEGLVIANSVAIYISMIYGLYLVRELLCFKLIGLQEIMMEAELNIKVGSKLLLANLSGMLMIGVVRFGISYGWDVITFGKISLILSISNFLMVFINSLSIVFFPMLKRIDENEQKKLYIKIRTVLMLLLFIGLLAYYPLKECLLWWLPKYKDSLSYMAVLLPICLYESRVVLLTNTYFKSLRQEAMMMKINVLMLLFSLLITFFCVEMISSLNLMVMSILLLFATKSMVSECCLGKLLGIKLFELFYVESLLILLFVVMNYFFEFFWGAAIMHCIGICFYYRFANSK